MPAFDLPADDVEDRLAHLGVVCGTIVRRAAQARPHHVEQFVRPRQAADMGREDTVRHGRYFIRALTGSFTFSTRSIGTFTRSSPTLRTSYM